MQMELVTSALEFPEGPVAMADGWSRHLPLHAGVPA